VYSPVSPDSLYCLYSQCRMLILPGVRLQVLHATGTRINDQRWMRVARLWTLGRSTDGPHPAAVRSMTHADVTNKKDNAQPGTEAGANQLTTTAAHPARVFPFSSNRRHAPSSLDTPMLPGCRKACQVFLREETEALTPQSGKSSGRNCVLNQSINQTQHNIAIRA